MIRRVRSSVAVVYDLVCALTPADEVAWAASLWPAAHNARWEALHGDTPLSGNAQRAQAAERLLLARA
jgi:hypothetical protein